MDIALLVVIACVLGGGVAGGLVTTWSLYRRTLRLEDLVNTLQDIVTRQDKRKAAEVRWTKADLQAAQLAEAMKHSADKPQPGNPWAFPM